MQLQREAERQKYETVYRRKTYAMGANRKHDAEKVLASLGVHGSYLDIGCGRGEMLGYAESLGYKTVRGVEQVSYLTDGERVIQGEVHALPFPDKSFDVVAMFDVIEHLLPGDDEAACRELNRVARKHVLLTASNNPSHCPDTGADLHINKRPYSKWDELFREWFDGDVIWRPVQTICPSEMMWRIDLP